MNSYIFLCLLSVVCNTVYTSVAYNRHKRNDELTLSAVKMHWKQKKGTFIVGGETAKLGDIPWIVALNSDRVCAGSIINKRTILTATHCTEGLKPKQLMVRAGSIGFMQGGSTYSVSRIVRHPNYSEPVQFNNDISLLILSKDIAIDNKTIAAVDLPAQGSGPAPGANVQVAGWGTLGDNNILPKYLQKVNTSIVGRNDCQKIFANVNENMICAGSMKGGKNACPGDSGGPLTLYPGKTQVGIVSNGISCAKKPVIYTRVGNYIDWIHKNEA